MLTGLIFPLLETSQAYGSSPLVLTQPLRTAFDHISLRQDTELLPRQVIAGSSPPQCKSGCDPVSAQLEQEFCGCCNSNFVIQYVNCLKCIGDALGVKDYTEAQVILDDFYGYCTTTLNIPVPKLTLPGIKPSPSSPQPAPATPKAPSPQAPPPPPPSPHPPANHPAADTFANSPSLASSPALGPVTNFITGANGEQTPTLVEFETVTSTNVQKSPQPTLPPGFNPFAPENGSVVSRHFSTPGFSHFVILSVLFFGLVRLLA